MQKIYEIKTKDALTLLKSDLSGLTSAEAKLRLEKYGLNQLKVKKPKSHFAIFWEQFLNPLIYILFGASIIILLLGKVIDSLIILFVLIFNAVIGTLQEGRAQNTLFALRSFVETKATALRDGKETVIADEQLVPGDIVILEEGDKVPADARIIASNNLRIDESALTGESEPVYKTVAALHRQKLTLADQKNMAFKGTHIVSGNGIGLIAATGSSTQIGKISAEIASETDDSPLKEDIKLLSKLIIWAVGVISILLFVGGILRGQGIREIFTTVVALAVSVIPEGLPIVVTLVLAHGVWRMASKNALVKKLQAVESLGQANIIAVDKTGTITKNEMVVRKIYTAGVMYDISGDGYDPKGEVYFEGKKLDRPGEDFKLLAKFSTLSANARIIYTDEKQWKPVGDPTQAAMVCLGQKFGYNKDELEAASPRILEIPFDYRNKYHIIVNNLENETFSIMAAAPEVAISFSSKADHNGKIHALGKSGKQELHQIYESMAAAGLRVIGLGYKKITGRPAGNPKDFIFLGFVGIADTIRQEAKKALKSAELAGMKVVMVTGDHKLTALAIAREVGIFKKGNLIMSGDQIDGMDDDKLSGEIFNVSIFARVTPEHKLRIIKAYQANGQIVAMTGDGVNDAPSLVAADLGVAMGKIGTEVAKQAADIVLLDDNFGSIVTAIDEGRNIYKTIKRVILYLFSTSFGEVLTISGALLLGLPLPLLATQIIWMNFVTDPFLDLSLALEPERGNLLKHKFFKPKKYLVDGTMLQRIIVMSLPMAVASVFMFSRYYQTDLTRAWTVTLTLLAMFEWFNAWNCRSDTKSIFQLNPFSNPALVAGTITVFALQVFAVHNHFMQEILHTTDLSVKEWVIIILVSSSIIIVEEIRKFIARKLQTT